MDIAERTPSATTMQLPEQLISLDVLIEKYCKEGENSADAIYARVARALAGAEKPELRAEWEQKFLTNLKAGAIGAGRIMSRNEAKRQFKVADQIAATAGVECRKDENVIDEIPMAYKDIDAVMQAQADLVEVVYTLKQVLCVKG